MTQSLNNEMWDSVIHMREKLIKRGAEAEIYLSKWHGRDVIIKKRTAKRYRNKELDRTLRVKRIKTEAKLISEARTLGVSTPIIYDIDTKECKLTMEYVDGIRVKEILHKLNERERMKLCNKVGQNIGKLHSNDIIHGDLTTSNMIVPGDAKEERKLPKNYKIYFIDLSLGEKNKEIEAKGTDLHVLKEAFESTHSELDCFGYVLDGYKKEYEKAGEVIAKIDEITRRGRYTT